MTTLADLINRHEWKEVKKRMKKLYPKPRKNLNGYKKVFEELKTLPVFTQGKRPLLIEVHACHDQYDGYYTDVHAVTPKKRGESKGLDATRWEKWLGMEIWPASLYDYSEVDIVCHCLWEMTFYGFDQDQIQSFWQSIDKESEAWEDALKDNIKAIPWEDVLKELEDESD